MKYILAVVVAVVVDVVVAVARQNTVCHAHIQLYLL